MIFLKREIIYSSWSILRQHLGFLVLIVLFIGGINLFLSIIQERILGEALSYQSIAFTIAATLFQMGLNLGIIKIALKILDKKDYLFQDLFGNFHILIPYVMATIVLLSALLIVALPGIIILLVAISWDYNSFTNLGLLGAWEIFIPALIIFIPVVYLSLRLQFYNYFLIDQECSILESILKSADITKGFVGELFLLEVILTVIILISLIPFGLGLLISIPFGTITITYVYKKLKSKF